MKRKHWITMCVIAAVLIFYIAIAVFAGGGLLPAGNGQTSSDGRQIDQLAQYLNEKYGYSVAKEDCIYFREEDYEPRKGWLGKHCDVPNIAIFKFDGKTVVTTERKGFYGDDGQLGQMNELLCYYFSNLTGLDIAFAELRKASSGNVEDWTLNELLHHEYNKLLTEDTISDFMDHVWQMEEDYHLIFYFKAEPDLAAQVEKITQNLSVLKDHANLRTMAFYITDMEDVNVLYIPPWGLKRTDKENLTEISEEYIWGHYHVVNDVEHHYPAREGSFFYDVPFNTFLTGGFWATNDRYSSGFGSRERTHVNGFEMVDLSDAALEGYLQEMVSYGQYHGYTVLFREGKEEGVTSLTITDGDLYKWSFRWDSGPVELYAFKNGQLLDLKTAYKCAYISRADMDAILQQHNLHRGRSS